MGEVSCSKNTVTDNPSTLYLPPYSAEDFKIASYNPENGWNEVADIEDGIRNLAKFINEKKVKAILLPGAAASPLSSALEILKPKLLVINDKKLIRLRTQNQTNEIIANNDELMKEVRCAGNRFLCLDDAIDSGRSLFFIRNAIEEATGIRILTGALFLLRNGESVEYDGSKIDFFGKKIPQYKAPSWYFKMLDPEAYDCGGLESKEEVLTQASEELALITRHITNAGLI